MKEIPLTGKHGAGKVALVDDEDYDELIKYKWCVHTNVNGNLYAIRSKSTSKKGNGKRGCVQIRMHRHIMAVTDKNDIVDHINRDSLDNRKENLRVTNVMWNNTNRMSKSGYKGVTKVGDKYQALIRHNNIQYWLGAYKSERDAAIAYNAASRVLHGKYGCLNVID
jgi:ribosomal protein L6P/L9E